MIAAAWILVGLLVGTAIYIDKESRRRP